MRWLVCASGVVLALTTVGSSTVLRAQRALTPAEVIASTERHHPRVQAAMLREEVAEAELMAARGGFDPYLSAYGALRTGGYYELRRLDVELRQPTPLWGAEVYAGYRYGRGVDDDANYPSYYDDETLRGGEIRAGLLVPLWRDGPFDARRAARARAELRIEQTQGTREAIELDLKQKAAEAYWKWVAAGRKLRVAEELLELATRRLEQTRARAAAGAIAEVDALEAERAVLSRQSSVIAARRGLEATALVLGLFVRDSGGDPRPPSEDRLPDGLPVPDSIGAADVMFPAVLACHPRLRAARASLRATDVDRDLARAQRGPRIDLGLEISRDLGQSDGDSTLPGTVFESKVRFAMPILLRGERGRLEATEQRFLAESEDLRLMEDDLRTELGDAVSQWNAARERYELAVRLVDVMRRLAVAEERRFQAGATDLLVVNLREQSLSEAELSLVDAAAELWMARARWDALTACAQ
ncbi:MAG: TolC family protein [Myxococcota bacterium]|jgi:outer membrane protein TolC|nr:TolC family protein [Myxococcota bacterium]